MSRVGKRPIPIPKDVKVSISVGSVDVQGPKEKNGQLKILSRNLKSISTVSIGILGKLA